VRTDRETVYSEWLVLRLKDGQKPAFEELIRHWEKRLFYYVRRIVPTEEDAWDVLQQTWMKVLKGIGSLKDHGALATWLYRIARDTALSRWREEYKERARRDESNDLTGLEAQVDDFRPEDAQRVHRALGRLSVMHREVLTLYFLDDLSMNQVAEVLEVPLGTVKSRLHHAKSALRSVLSQEDGRHD